MGSTAGFVHAAGPDIHSGPREKSIMLALMEVIRYLQSQSVQFSEAADGSKFVCDDVGVSLM